MESIQSEIQIWVGESGDGVMKQGPGCVESISLPATAGRQILSAE